MRLLGAVCALEKDGGVGAEFVNDLAACPARRAGDAVIVGNGDRLNFDLGSELRDRGKDCSALGAVGHAIGSVFHVASGKYFAVREQDGGAHVKVRVGSVRVLHHLGRSALQSLLCGGRNVFLAHKGA